MPRPGLPRLTFPQLWLGVAVLLPAVAALLTPLSTVDLAYALRAGSEMLDGGGIPRADTYTFTVAGQPWLDQQWGAQLVLAAWWRLLGWPGLLLLRSLLIAAAWAALVAAIRQRAPGLGARATAVLVLAAFVVTAPAMALRAQLLAILLFCLVLALLAGRRRHGRLVWTVPVLVAAWANVHGSFVLGPVLAGLAWVEDVGAGWRRGAVVPAAAMPGGRRLRGLGLPGRRLLTPSLVVLVATVAATLVTPFGPGALVYALTLSSNRELAARVSEWQPPSLAEGDGLLFFGSLVAVAAVAVARRRRLPLAGWLTLAGFAALGLVAVRGEAWWPAAAAVTIAPLLARDAAPSPFRRPPRASAANTLILAALALAGILLLPIGVPPDPGLAAGAPPGVLVHAPHGVTSVLRSLATREDRVWAPQLWGSWLELAVPAAPVALDSRIELFPADLWADADMVAAAREGWQGVLDRRAATIVVVAAPDAALLAAARADPGWREVPVPQPSGGRADGAVFVRAGRS